MSWPTDVFFAMSRAFLEVQLKSLLVGCPSQCDPVRVVNGSREPRTDSTWGHGEGQMCSETPRGKRCGGNARHPPAAEVSLARPAAGEFGGWCHGGPSTGWLEVGTSRLQLAHVSSPHLLAAPALSPLCSLCFGLGEPRRCVTWTRFGDEKLGERQRLPNCCHYSTPLIGAPPAEQPAHRVVPTCGFLPPAGLAVCRQNTPRTNLHEAPESLGQTGSHHHHGRSRSRVPPGAAGNQLKA